MNAWSHLPNAAYIDRILESLKTHPDIWDTAFDDTRNRTLSATRCAASNAARLAVQVAARDTAWAAARDTIWYAAGARQSAWAGCRNAVAALVAWDDSAQFLEMTGDKLEVWMRISDDPRAILLLPAVRVFERTKELETA